VKSAQEKIEVSFPVAVDEVAGVYTVIDEGRGAVSLGVIRTEADDVAACAASPALVAVQGKDPGLARRSSKWRMCVDDFCSARHKGAEIEAGLGETSRVQWHQICFGYRRAARCDQRYLVAQLGQPAGEPDDDPLSSSVSADRQSAVGIQRNVHGGSMYGRASVPGKRGLTC